MFDISFTELIVIILVAIISMNSNDIIIIYKKIYNFIDRVNSFVKQHTESIKKEILSDSKFIDDEHKKIIDKIHPVRTGLSNDIKPNIKLKNHEQKK